MARNSEDITTPEPRQSKRIKEAKEKAYVAKERRESVLPNTAPTEVSDSIRVEEVNSISQLQAMVKKGPALVLQMIQELRLAADERIKLGDDLHFMTTLIEKYNTRIAALRQELHDTTAELREAREITGRKKGVKWPDAPILTGNDDPTFATWVQKVIKKYTKDYPDDVTDQIDYAISRTGGVVANTIKPRLVIGAEPFESLDEVFEYIGAWMEDPDPRATARQKLRDTKQNKQEFSKFFGEWLQQIVCLNHDQAAQIENLIEKIDIRLRWEWDRQIPQPETMEGARRLLLKLDNAMRATDKLADSKEKKPASFKPGNATN